MRCHAKGCRALAMLGFPMCKEHWGMVPPDAKEYIQAANEAGNDSKHWMLAVNRAIRIVFEREKSLILRGYKMSYWRSQRDEREGC